jgi:Flp pilus assembly protein TadD
MLLGAFYLSGCAESTTAVPAGGWAQGGTDSEFQTQAGRPPTTKTLWAMADILASQGKDSECEYVLKRIIQNDPKFLPAYNSLAELQMRRGQTNAATVTLQDALRIGPENPVLLNNLGMCWLVRRDYDNALRVFDKAAGIAPENAKYRANMAVALGLMGREEESLALFKQVLPEDQAARNVEVLRQARKDAERASTAPPP